MRACLPELAFMSIQGLLHDGDAGFIPLDEAWAILREESPIDYGDQLEEWRMWIDRTYSSSRRAAIQAEDFPR